MGGEFFEVVLSQMNSFGRVSVCGAISQYNLEQPATGDVWELVLCTLRYVANNKAIKQKFIKVKLHETVILNVHHLYSNHFIAELN